MHSAPTTVSELDELILSYNVNNDEHPTLLVINTSDGDKLMKNIMFEKHGIDPDKKYEGNASFVGVYDYKGVRIIRSSDIYPHESYYIAHVSLKYPD